MENKHYIALELPKVLSRLAQFTWLKEQGFSVVPYRVVNSVNVAEAVQAFAEEVKVPL